MPRYLSKVGLEFLGKKGDPAAVYWEAHPDYLARSDDGFRLTCISETETGILNRERTRVYFKPSAVGGDDFQVKCAVKCSDSFFADNLKLIVGNVFTVCPVLPPQIFSRRG